MTSGTHRRWTTALDIPPRVTSYQSPYWHRPGPLVAVVPIDPRRQALSRHFPDSWQYLVRAKTLLDGVSHLEAPGAVSPSLHHRRIAPLLLLAADELTRFATVQEAGSAHAISTHARTASDRLRWYVQEATWPSVVLGPPSPGEPWLYCGPLSTWAMHATQTPLGFLLVCPRADLQPEADAVDAGIDIVQAAMSRTLGGPVCSTLPIRPTMQIADLLLAGGESASGHKNFAHFFPLETPAATVEKAEFTVVFSNVYAQRLSRCSLELLRRYLGEDKNRDADNALHASIMWFRAHDLAHFWRLQTLTSGGHPNKTLNQFERKTLEEAYADVLGVVSASSLSRSAVLGQAFTAELLRYLSRDYSHFADSAAAILTIGWLRANRVSLDFADDHWLSAALPALEELGRVIHHVLWEGSNLEIPSIRAAIRCGREFCQGLQKLFTSVPTDIEYTFG